MNISKYKPIMYFDENIKGNDYVVSDIHGEFINLENKLKKINFNEKKDRLFSVGDLTDRGGFSHLVLDWLKKPWFIPVKGNHEMFTIDTKKLSPNQLLQYRTRIGGEWFFHLTPQKRSKIIEEYKKLPIAIEVKTEKGKIIIVHADLPTSTWAIFEKNMKTVNYKIITATLHNTIRATTMNQIVPDVRAVICGHMTGDKVRKQGNFYLIDTGSGFDDGELTIFDIKNLKEVK